MLLGTQMVAKGHHFAASSSRRSSTPTRASRMPDFRAEERTFQLITQLAGRSGRDAPGRVIVQTFQPDARADRARGAARRRAVPRRRSSSGGEPSATRRSAHLVRIVVAGPELEPVVRALEELKAGIRGAELLGPAPLLRLRGRYRAQLVAKTDAPAAPRLAGGAPARGGGAGDAQRRADGGRGRRSAEPLGGPVRNVQA